MRHHGYRLRVELFHALEPHWGPHSIDRFATVDNCQPFQGPHRAVSAPTTTVWKDAISWEGENNWVSRDAKERLAAVIRRRTWQPRQLKQTSHTVEYCAGHARRVCTSDYLEPRRRPPTLHHWWPSGRSGAWALRGTATSQPSEIGSDSPRRTESPRSRPSRRNSSASSRCGRRGTPAARQMKLRICAIDAASQLAVVPSPSGDATDGALRRGARRVKHTACGSVRLGNVSRRDSFA